MMSFLVHQYGTFMQRISTLLVTSLVTVLGLTACSTTPITNPQTPLVTSSKDGAPKFAVDVTHLKDAVPKYEPKSYYGNPHSYSAIGKRYYVLETAKGYKKTGVASWYGTKFHGRPTSSREPYDMLAMTAASPSLPIPTYVKVTNLENGKQVVVRVNDRGPFIDDRVMDLSFAAAKKLGYAEKGTARVTVEAISFEPPSSKIMLASANRLNLNEKPRTMHSAIYLQVGSYHQRERAQQVKMKVAELTHQSARIETVTLKDKTLYRVQVGPLLSEMQKSDIAIQLNQQGYGHAVAVISQL